MKIFLIFVLLFTLAGCSARRVETSRVEYSPTRSIVRDVAPVPIPPAPIPPETTAQDFSSQEIPAREVSQDLGAPRNSGTSHYSTEFDTSDTGRSTNIRLAVNAISGTVVQSGEEFSFNSTVGSTTAEHGYKKGVIFSGGKKSMGYGGGVCQVSTTLCNAAIQAGMTITERHDHSLPVNYVKDGVEAATSNSGNLDFKFQNNTPHAVIIHANADNGTVEVSVKQFGSA